MGYRGYNFYYILVNHDLLLQGEETQVVDPRVIHVMLAEGKLNEVCFVSPTVCHLQHNLFILRLEYFLTVTATTLSCRAKIDAKRRVTVGKVRAVDDVGQHLKEMKTLHSNVSKELGKVPLTARMEMAPTGMLRLW